MLFDAARCNEGRNRNALDANWRNSINSQETLKHARIAS